MINFKNKLLIILKTHTKNIEKLGGLIKSMPKTAVFFLISCSIPAFLFLKKREQKIASKLETMAGIWTIGMYLSLGGIPMILHFIRGINGL